MEKPASLRALVFLVVMGGVPLPPTVAQHVAAEFCDVQLQDNGMTIVDLLLALRGQGEPQSDSRRSKNER